MKSAEQLIRETREEWTALAYKHGFEWDKGFFDLWSINHALVIAKIEALDVPKDVTREIKCTSCGETLKCKTYYNNKTKEIGCHILCEHCGYAYINTYQSETEYWNDIQNFKGNRKE